MYYTFHRDIYYALCNDLAKTNVIFLLGPRKCGKTVCLKQLARETSNTVYVDFKGLTYDEGLAQLDTIIASIEGNNDVVYLLDEITYAPKPENAICLIADTFADLCDAKTKVVFTGSQSVALERWAHRAFGGRAKLLRTDFLSYPEFLRYKGLCEVSEESYNRFLYEVTDFYGITSLADYLTGCLEETVISNAKTSNYLYGNDVFLLTEDPEVLLDVCYQTLFTLHNHVNAQTFSKDNKLYDDILFHFRDVCSQLDNKTIADRIEQSFIGRYSSFCSRSTDIIKQALTFLSQCGLIVITPVAYEWLNVPNVRSDLYRTDSKIAYKEDLFKAYNTCIRYPMFYVQILKDILRDEMPAKLPQAILGSIVECHIRGILPDPGFEFHDVQDREVDYVSLINNVAIEFSVSRKKKRVHFDIIPENMRKILLTRNDKSLDVIRRIPYYEFIYNGLNETLNKEFGI